MEKCFQGLRDFCGRVINDGSWRRSAYGMAGAALFAAGMLTAMMPEASVWDTAAVSAACVALSYLLTVAWDTGGGTARPDRDERAAYVCGAAAGMCVYLALAWIVL